MSAAGDLAAPAAVSARPRLRRLLVVAGFGLIGIGLAWSRLVGLNQSLWHDEITSVVRYVQPGPRAIFDDYVPNDHMLFNLLTWVMSSVLGHTEVAYRLWSVVPFVAGVVLIARWLTRLDGVFAAGTFAFLATASPLLLDWSRQARGYGLAFFAMSLLTIAVFDFVETRARRDALLICVAGVIGTWDLPVFGLTFAAVGALLLAERSLRARLLPWLGVSLLAVVLWYLPVSRDVASSSQQEYGFRLNWHAVVTGPFNDLLAPSLIPNGGVHHRGLVAFLVFGLPLTVGARVLFRQSPLAAAAVVSGVAGTYGVLSFAQFYVETRFLSYLLVPVLVFVAVGVSRMAKAVVVDRPAVRVLASTAFACGIVWLGAVFVTSALLATRYPFEAYKGAAAAIDGRLPGARVVANLPHPADLRYYLHRPFLTPAAGRLETVVCGDSHRALIYVEQPFRTPRIDLGCLRRAGATRDRFVQYTRGDRIDVWFRPGSTQ